ncbi:hypothetical protein MSAN_02187800 [Mycena sanguinolenta]|uniref:Uncharacterized protein n=1 Tax=Mycena sanguinolenta TaxID=230812 RepID=A0A8H6XE58_9AGAR|nr:hypothetical protein MSAN_02187800 [Mycena sanguinolenta]
MAIAGPNCIRLYSFPLPFMTALRRLLDSKKLVTALREDIAQQMCEISLGGKPWSSAKSISTEKLLVEIFQVIYAHGYTYLSQIDYGRESDDRLAMAFSKPAVRSLSPLSPSDSPLPVSASLNKQSSRRVPFALSFASATVLRVIAPPLHSTPAILNAVRGSWPRGVVSERKIDDCFEFKLKGYKWFHEDTFATDSLRHILSLLSSLDAHSFSLLTSLTLTGRSRVKDLWIFTGPAATTTDSLPESPAPSILNNSSAAELGRRPVPEIPGVLSPTSLNSQQSLHRRLASEPSAPTPLSPSHARAATDSPTGSGNSRRFSNSNILRKAAPRAQVPVSVHDMDSPPLNEGYRANLPSVVPEDQPNLTGVGASGRTPDVFYATSPFHRNQEAESPFTPILPVGDASQPASYEASPPRRASPSERGPRTPPQLLSPGAFRDSAFSSASASMDDIPIPIKWTGEERESLGPPFPGGWQPTPIDEKPEDMGGFDTPENPIFEEEQEALPTPDVQDVVHRVASPELQETDLELRKSEAGLVGLIAATENQEPSEGKGWVVVDVEGKSPSDNVAVPAPKDTLITSPEPQSPASPSIGGTASPPPHPVAKAIAAVDAIEAKNKSGSKSPKPSTDSSPSGIRKFFSSRKKKNSNPPPPSPAASLQSSSATSQASKTPTTKAAVSVDDTKRAIELVHNHSEKSRTDKEKDSSSKLPGATTRLKDKLRLVGTPELSPRDEDKRMSIN